MIKVKSIENDTNVPRHQDYFVCSIIHSNKLEKCKVKNMIAFKCYGVFATEKEADEKCKKLKLDNKKIDNIIGEVGNLHSFDIEKADVTEYQNNKLNC